MEQQIINPIGIDAQIENMRKHLFTNLFVDRLTTNVWDDSKIWNDLEIWNDYASGQGLNRLFGHRIYKIDNKSGEPQPSLYAGGNEYQNVKFDDRYDVIMWFDVKENTSAFNFGAVQDEVDIFFIVNLKTLYPTLQHRAVEEVHLEVYKQIIKRNNWNVTNLVRGEGAYDYNIDDLKHADAQPFHVFKYTCRVDYTLECN